MNSKTRKAEKRRMAEAKAVNTRLSEFFDGHVVVGFRAGTGEALIIHPDGHDEKTVIALNALLMAAVRSK